MATNGEILGKALIETAEAQVAEAQREERPAPTHVQVMSYGEIRAEAERGDWVKVAQIDNGIGESVYVWVDEMTYRVAMLRSAYHAQSTWDDTYTTDVISMDTLAPGYDWVKAFRWAMEFATELHIAETKLSLG